MAYQESDPVSGPHDSIVEVDTILPDTDWGKLLEDILEQISDISSEDPLEIVIQIEQRLRPDISGMPNAGEFPVIRKYHAAVKHACEVFSVPFNAPSPASGGQTEMRQLFDLTRLEIETKQIDMLKQRLDRSASVELNPEWRQKIHSYIANIRPIVEKAAIPTGLRDSIMNRLNALAKEIDRSRTRVRVFADTLVEVCMAMGTAANELKPVMSILERMVTAIAKLQGTHSPLALPPPESFGLDTTDPVTAPPIESETTEA